MFDGFESQRIDTGEVRLHCRTGGSGPPLLLVHGYPQCHVMWHKVAPGLAQHFQVVAADMRGYGASDAPPAGDDGMGYAKRTLARDLVPMELARTSGATATPMGVRSVCICPQASLTMIWVQSCSSRLTTPWLS